MNIKELNFDKNLFYENLGMAGYFERENALSVDVMYIDRLYNTVVVGFFGQEELYEVQLQGNGRHEYFEVGVEMFFMKDMIPVKNNKVV